MDYLQNVLFFIKEKDYGRAFAYSMCYLELLPAEKEGFEELFRSIVFAWASELGRRNRMEDLLKVFVSALKYYPNDVQIWGEFGAHLLRLDLPNIAYEQLKIAYNLDKDNLYVEENLNTAKLALVDSWHFRMLNDLKRNKLYFEAILATIDEKYNKVLDIGAGSGLLSLFASKNAATKKIQAIEICTALCQVAEKCFKANNVSNATVINTMSTYATGLDLSNVLICEIFDCAMFGEGVLETLIHAHQTLLEKDCKIIPSSSNVYITGIESVDLYKKYSFSNRDLKHLNMKDVCIKMNTFNNPYRVEYIKKCEHKILSKTEKIVTVDFTDLNQLKKLFNIPFAIPNLSLEITEKGILHCFVIWFDLKLSETVTITTNPYEDNCKCWHQAIIYLDHPIEVEKGTTIDLKISCIKNKLVVKLLNEENPNVKCFKVSQQLIHFLNDTSLIETLDSIEVEGEKLKVLDLHRFPIVGLNLALKKSEIVTTCSYNQLLKHVCGTNNINMSNITIIEEEVLEDFIRDKTKYFDVIIFDPISINGTINESIFKISELFVASLKDDGRFLPSKIYLDYRIIELDGWEKFTRVNDHNMLGFKVAEFMNHYALPEEWSFTIKTYKSLSKPQTDRQFLYQRDLNLTKHNVEIIMDGIAKGIVYGVHMHFSDKLSLNTFNSNYYKQSTFIFKENKILKKGDVLKVCVKQHYGFLKIFLE